MARMQEANETSANRRSPRSGTARSRPTPSDAQQRVLQDYENAVQLMQDGRFEKARAIFERLVRDAPAEILERSRIYLTVCERNARVPSLSFNSPEEQYDYAVSLLNNGAYEDARDQFEAILSRSPESDFAHYGMAVLNSMTGQAEEALEHLGRAIELNPSNRIQARSDPDFVDMADDPRFTELLYPEMG